MNNNNLNGDNGNYDLTVWECAKDIATALDKAYLHAKYAGNKDEMEALRPMVDNAYGAIGRARMNLLIKAGVLATKADVSKMRKIKKQIDNAADTQQMILGVVNFIGFFSKFK